MEIQERRTLKTKHRGTATGKAQQEQKILISEKHMTRDIEACLTYHSKKKMEEAREREQNMRRLINCAFKRSRLLQIFNQILDITQILPQQHLFLLCRLRVTSTRISSTVPGPMKAPRERTSKLTRTPMQAEAEDSCIWRTRRIRRGNRRRFRHEVEVKEFDKFELYLARCGAHFE
ncbi:hypothetical protein I7I48_05238 [Histoplasma ohiense]|nr:hypothetical protein I7I48_05238 [Histoplasma ohiense (nom. inval.)]